MQQTKFTKLKESILIGRLLRGTLVASTVFILTFIVAPYIATESYAATTASVETSWESLSLTLDPDYAATQAGGSVTDSGHGDINFGEVTPTGKNTSTSAYGTQKVAKKTIRVVTSGKYYAVYLSTGTTATTNALEITASDSDQTIAAISDGTNQATFNDTQSFTRTGWGYAVPGTSITGADFSSSATYASYDGNLAGTSFYDNLTKTGTGSAFYNTGTWAAVPLYANAQQIYKNSNASRFTSGDTFDIYYSVMVDTDVMAGTYQTEVLYTAMASTTDLDTASNNMSRSTEYVTSGTEETLKIDLATTSEPLNTSNVKVYLVPHSVFAGNSYSVSSLTTSNYNECTVNNVTSSNLVDGNATTATITCNIPTIGTVASGTSPDTITIAGDNSTCQANGDAAEEGDTCSGVTGEYDFWVRATTMGRTIDYVSHYTENSTDTPAVVYAGLQSKRTSTNGGETYITEMQEMTGNICKNTNMWGTGVGEDAQIYDYLGESGNNALLSTGADTPGISTFTLTDNRDNKNYRIRRLADDNCWMSQNLALNLADFAGTNGLTSRNTDLNSKQVWDPSKSTVEKYTSTYASKLESQGLTKDFSGLTELLLGMAEGAQFQSTEQTGYHWCSRIKDDGSYERDTACRSNTYAEIPRSYYYDDEYGTYYNWYAATAESGRYLVTTSNGVADSVCPFGWQLPGTGGNKGYSTLFVSKYQIASSTVLSGSTATAFRDKIKLLPFTFMHAGNYTGGNNEAGLRGIDAYIYIHTSIGAAYNHGASQEIWSSSTTEITLSGPVSSTNGAIVRCVARD